MAQQVVVKNGMRTFLSMWGAQLVSVIGTQLSAFALGVWVYETTRSVTMSALTMWAFGVPQVLLSPLAGVLVDRWGRWKAMIVSDVGAGLSVLCVALLYNSNLLEPWMIIPINFCLSTFNSLMWPAQSASITLLVPKEHYGRANGMVQTLDAISQVAGPAMAGSLYVLLKIGNLALIDFISYIAAIMIMVLFVRIPEPPKAAVDPLAPKPSLLKEMRFGWDYIVARKGLVSLLSYFVVINILNNMIQPLFAPLVLDNWSADVFGYLGTVMGVGMLAGTIVMSAWGGTKRKVIGLLGSGIVAGVFLAVAGLRASIPLLAICGFGFMFSFPIMNASSQAIWQSKVDPAVQGRVFSVRRGIAWSSGLIMPLLAGPLADYVAKPAMSAGGALAPVLGPIFGVGADRGIGLMFTVIGIATALVSAGALLIKRMRNIEVDLPDHAVATASEGVDSEVLVGSDQPAESVPA